MKSSFLFPAALALLASGTLALPWQKTTASQEGKPVPAAAPLMRSQVPCELTLPVTGMTAENTARVKSVLEAMKVDLYRCNECKADFAKSGECPKCKKPLTERKEVVLGTVTPDATKGLIMLRSREGMEMKLSMLEKNLEPEAVRVDVAKLELKGPMTLVIADAVTAEQALSIEKAMKEGKLFQTIEAEATPHGVLVHVTGAMAPTLGHVREVVAKVNGAFKVKDVIWNDWSPRFAG